MVERIAELVREKKIDGLPTCATRATARVSASWSRLNAKRCRMWCSTSSTVSRRCNPLSACNIVALDGGRPLVMKLKDLLTAFIAFREEVVSRRTKHLLGKARDRAHVLVGLAIAVANIDEVID